MFAAESSTVPAPLPEPLAAAGAERLADLDARLRDEPGVDARDLPGDAARVMVRSTVAGDDADNEWALAGNG